MKNFIKLAPTSIKTFLLSLIIGIALFIILPKDDCGNICGTKSLIPVFIFGLMIIIPFLFSIIDLIRKKISFKRFIDILILIILLFFFMGVIFFSLSGARCRAHGARTLFEINQLVLVQEMFYSENNRYADTQEELIESGLIDEKFKNWSTKKEITDRDGTGIEGGDDNPETWLVTTYIPQKKIDEWCRVMSEGYWYTCNQNGCQEE